MPEDMWDAEYGEPDDVCEEDLADGPGLSGPPVTVLLGLLAEGLALVAMGAWILIVG